MKRMTQQAPAKVNLALDILGRRPDGYHDMRMVMQAVSLCDTVTAEETEGGFALHTGGDFIPAGKKTLEQRAAEAFFTAISRPIPGLSVTLEKRTPAYAGLGGGSADVAALLRILRRAYAPDMPTAELERIGFTVGSDMPFCVRGGTALAEGRGERLTPLPPLPRCHVVLCKPAFSVSTPDLFERIDGVRLRRRPDTLGLLGALEAGDLAGVARRMYNVFEDALPPRRAGEIGEIRNSLIQYGALGASMSGTGPTVFGLFRDASAARHACSALRETYRETFLAQGLEPVE